MNLWIILLILFLVYFRGFGITEGFQNTVDWRARYGEISPRERLPELIAEFGQPDLIDTSAGGGAIWFKKTLRTRGKKYEQALILDEAILHAKPAPHADFFYTQVRLVIPCHYQKRLNDILGLSKSVQYDPLKQVLTVRCHFSGANKATMYLAIKIALGILTLEKIKKYDLYSKAILKTIPGHASYEPEAEHNYEAFIFEYVDALESKGM